MVLQIYELKVLDTKPAEAVSIIECDMKVLMQQLVYFTDIDQPCIDYTHMQQKQHISCQLMLGISNIVRVDLSISSSNTDIEIALRSMCLFVTVQVDFAAPVDYVSPVKEETMAPLSPEGPDDVSPTHIHIGAYETLFQLEFLVRPKITVVR